MPPALPTAVILSGTEHAPVSGWTLPAENRMALCCLQAANARQAHALRLSAEDAHEKSAISTFQPRCIPVDRPELLSKELDLKMPGTLAASSSCW